VIEGDFLHSPDTVLTPAGGGDGFHQHGFGGRTRLVFVEEFVEQREELLFLLIFQDDSLGEQPMAGAVAGGVEFALRGDGTFGTGSVGSGGGDLFGSTHSRVEYGVGV